MCNCCNNACKSLFFSNKATRFAQSHLVFGSLWSETISISPGNNLYVILSFVLSPLTTTRSFCIVYLGKMSLIAFLLVAKATRVQRNSLFSLKNQSVSSFLTDPSLFIPDDSNSLKKLFSILFLGPVTISLEAKLSVWRKFRTCSQSLSAS